MTDEITFKVHFTQIEDGSWLAASVSTPWFCLAAETEDAVIEKANRAISFWCGNRDARIDRNLDRTVAPFAPRRVETLRMPALCA
ncbi:MAG: hypothetical protein M3Q57_09305 [Pseudomonadota bacterium]|nr:hypothetical protein [Pseudomonadota bacterium]